MSEFIKLGFSIYAVDLEYSILLIIQGGMDIEQFSILTYYLSVGIEDLARIANNSKTAYSNELDFGLLLGQLDGDPRLTELFDGYSM